MTPHQGPIWSIVIHHTEENPCSFKDVQDFHRNVKGWKEIGYHWFVDQYGVVTPGRDEKLRGAHALGRNDGTISVCLEGDFRALARVSSDKRRPGPEWDKSEDFKWWQLPRKPDVAPIGQMSALLELLHQIRRRHGDIPILSHQEVMGLQVGNRRPDPDHTDCPGVLMHYVRAAAEAEAKAEVGE